MFSSSALNLHLANAFLSISPRLIRIEGLPVINNLDLSNFNMTNSIIMFSIDHNINA